MNVPLRLLKEFWAPALVAAAWTTYSLYASGELKSLKAAIATFCPAFFLASWASGQFFRVKKQAAVESKLGQIEGRAEALLEKLDQHVKDFSGHIYGAPSGVHLIPRVASNSLLELALVIPSTYPVIGFSADISIHKIGIGTGIDSPVITERLSRDVAFPQTDPLVVTNIHLQNERTAVIVRMATRTHAVMQIFVVHRAVSGINVAFRTYASGDCIQEHCPVPSLKDDLLSLADLYT